MRYVHVNLPLLAVFSTLFGLEPLLQGCPFIFTIGKSRLLALDSLSCFFSVIRRYPKPGQGGPRSRRVAAPRTAPSSGCSNPSAAPQWAGRPRRYYVESG